LSITARSISVSLMSGVLASAKIIKVPSILMALQEIMTGGPGSCAVAGVATR